MACPANDYFIRACDFTQLLVDQQPKYDKLIVESIRPQEGWVGHVATGVWPSFSGVGMYQDRFEHVYPDTTWAWTDMITENAGNTNVFGIADCAGNPCDPVERCIGWGSSRTYFGLHKQSWASQILCFDQLMHVTHAKEQWRQIINRILKPATNTIVSTFLKKRAMAVISTFNANQCWTASAAMTPFTYTWQSIGGREIYLCTNVAPTAIFKLTPQMLQRRVDRLLREGYWGESPFKESIPLAELVLDMDTCWELDRLATTGGVPSVTGNWRFTQWDAASPYWRYGFNGQLGNYATRVDPEQFRFYYQDALGPGANIYRYRVIQPLRNRASSGAGGAAGLRSEFNPDYQTAPFRLGYIWHNKVMECLVSDATPINPEMPFSSRNFAGKWQFVMDNLGVDSAGTVIENKRRNKGQFIADFKMAARPMYPEFGEVILYKAEPARISDIDTCLTVGTPNTDFESSCNYPCDYLQD